MTTSRQALFKFKYHLVTPPPRALAPHSTHSTRSRVLRSRPPPAFLVLPFRTGTCAFSLLVLLPHLPCVRASGLILILAFCVLASPSAHPLQGTLYPSTLQLKTAWVCGEREVGFIYPERSGDDEDEVGSLQEHCIATEPYVGYKPMEEVRFFQMQGLGSSGLQAKTVDWRSRLFGIALRTPETSHRRSSGPLPSSSNVNADHRNLGNNVYIRRSQALSVTLVTATSTRLKLAEEKVTALEKIK
ncbi:hypothetical protein B0H11DRAFT_2191800 [Mycena galericulata]|nr:hypothetical protein B0H11DRAFT_2191800 [Mycena galericulata]